MPVKYLFFFLGCSFFAHTICAQKRTLYIRPDLGIEMPLAKNTLNNLQNAALVNNDPWLVLKYSLSLEWMSKKGGFYISYGNGQAGFSMGVRHTISCSGYNGSYGNRYTAESANDKRLSIGTIFSLSSKEKIYKAISFEASIQAGFGVDFRSNEDLNAGQIIFPSINRCGEEYYLKDTVYARKNIGFVLPLQVNLNSFLYKKPSFSLSVFYNLGLSKHYLADVDYVTNSYTDKTSFKIKGTSLGIKLSYPIKIAGQKRH